MNAQRQPSSPPMDDDAIIEVCDPEENSGFLICNAGSETFRVLYADLRARAFFCARPVVGAPLDALFELDAPEDLLARLRATVAGGDAETFFAATRDRDGALIDLHVHVRPLAGGDGHTPWALCTFDVVDDGTAPGHRAPMRLPDYEQAEVGQVVERLAERLSFLLPGHVEVSVEMPTERWWVAASAEDIEEIVSCCLATAMPFDPWRYAVKLVGVPEPEARRIRLVFGLVGDRDGAMLHAPLPGGVPEHLDALGFSLEPDHRLVGCTGLALVMPLAPETGRN